MKDIFEIVVISGKGGTGKTSLTASLVPWLNNITIADCDVDGPDLHILMEPRDTIDTPFVGTKKAVVNSDACTKCGLCARSCKFDAITPDITISRVKCEGCGVCKYVCPMDAITMEDAVVGSVKHSETDYGPMVHARLIPGEETSGKLVSQVRQEAKNVARTTGRKTIIIDGPPGIGCNVISAITGADMIVIVTEPTASGLHDLQRVFTLTGKFHGKVTVIINRSSISQEYTEKIESFCNENDIEVLTKIPLDKRIVQSIVDKEIPSVKEKDFFLSFNWEEVAKKVQEKAPS